MFISNIISKLPTIIYKSEIIYKATTTPTNKDQHSRSTNINIGSLEPFHTTVIHDLLTHSAHNNKLVCVSLLLIRATFKHYLLYSPYTYSYLSVRVLYFAGPLSYQRHFSKPMCEVRDPLNHIHTNVSRFWILVRIFGAHRMAAVKHTLRLPINPLTSIHG